MALDKKAIETISVSAVRNSVVTSPFLDQFIPDNDKEPSWDGNVYIYKNAAKTKREIDGRMPVQVKGTVCDDFSKEEISYSMEVSDLQNYLHDGGAILFVVYMTASGAETKIYYVELTPIKLRGILEEAGKQRTKTVYLKEFPADGNQKATIFMNCLQNCRKQSSFTDIKLPSLEEIEKNGLLESISIPWCGVGIKDPIAALLTSEVYMYANIRGSSIPQPIDLVPKNLGIRVEQSALVKAGDRQFYSKVSILRDAQSTTLQFGKSLTLCFLNNKSPCKVNYKNSTSLRTLSVDLDFMLTYIETGFFMLNDSKIPFDYSGGDISNFNVDRQKERLKFAKRTVQVLDTLNCRKDLDLSNLSGENVRDLIQLGVALIDNKPVSGLREDIPILANIDIGQLKFTLMFVPDEEHKGTYTITDFFKSDLTLGYRGEKGNELRTSQYAIYHAEDLIRVSNLRPELFLPSFKGIENEESYIRANFFLLELLDAYDRSGDVRKDLLETAHGFAEWLKDAPEEQLEFPIKILNYFQVIKRERVLESDEQKVLWDLVDKPNISDSCKVGAYLLLDQQIPAKQWLNKLPKSEQKAFKTFPIYRFWKN